MCSDEFISKHQATNLDKLCHLYHLNVTLHTSVALDNCMNILFGDNNKNMMWQKQNNRFIHNLSIKHIDSSIIWASHIWSLLIYHDTVRYYKTFHKIKTSMNYYNLKLVSSNYYFPQKKFLVMPWGIVFLFLRYSNWWL